MVECPVSYPATLPVECIQEIVRIVRAGTVRTEFSHFAQHAWVVQGYLQRQTLGAPIEPVIGDASPEGCLAALEHLAENPAGPGVVGAPAIPWATLLRWLLETLLREAFV